MASGRELERQVKALYLQLAAQRQRADGLWSPPTTFPQVVPDMVRQVLRMLVMSENGQGTWSDWVRRTAGLPPDAPLGEVSDEERQRLAHLSDLSDTRKDE